MSTVTLFHNAFVVSSPVFPPSTVLSNVVIEFTLLSDGPGLDLSSIIVDLTPFSGLVNAKTGATWNPSFIHAETTTGVGSVSGPLSYTAIFSYTPGYTPAHNLTLRIRASDTNVVPVHFDTSRTIQIHADALPSASILPTTGTTIAASGTTFTVSIASQLMNSIAIDSGNPDFFAMSDGGSELPYSSGITSAPAVHVNDPAQDLSITFNGTETAFSHGVFAPGWSGTVTPSGSGSYSKLYDPPGYVNVFGSTNYVITLTRAATITSGTASLSVTAQDIDATSGTTVTAAYLLPVVPKVGLFPAFDTVRGGRQVVAYTDQKFFTDGDTYDFKAQSLPSGGTASTSWSAGTVGSGSATSRLSGTTLSTGSVVGSSATLSSGADFEAFDATLRARLIAPNGDSANAVTMLQLSYTVDSITFLRLAIGVAPLTNGRNLAVTSLIGLTDGAQDGGGYLIDRAPNLDVILRIVRYGRFAQLLFGDIVIAETDRLAPAGPGTMSISVSNLASNAKVQTVIDSLSIGSNALIGGRFLVNTTDFSSRRLTGQVPPAGLSEVGTADIILFGPWGDTTLTDAFEYQLPAGRTIGGQNSTPLVTYVDSTLKD